jgi:hypothetical protein
MQTKLTLTGTYVKEADGYFSQTNTHRLVIGHRSPKNGKTPDFLILKPCCGIPTLPDGSREKYVSGIFYTSSTTGRIDFQGTFYTLTFTPDNKLTVQPLQGGGKVL